ncbi:Flp1 family type IVb pilin [Paenibacillus sp. GYB003]|uniref:Flp1 family type IVb pilin n=1 Tax=Paenibacillus sp. GYB003 TaxID=2994392 RepID=UPI002F968BFB
MSIGSIRQRIGQFGEEEDGIGTLELLLIVAVLVIVAVAFRKWILAFIKKLFGEANEELGNTGAKDCLSAPDACKNQ